MLRAIAGATSACRKGYSMGDHTLDGLRAGYGLAASAITELDTFVDKQATFG